MTGNSSLFSTFQSQPSSSTVTLADGSHSCVLGSSTIVSTPSIPLTSVLSLPNFSFNLMSVSKLTRALKCYISFFPNFCLFQNLMTKQILVDVVSLGVYTSLILQSQDLLLVLESLHHLRHIAGWVIFRCHC